MDGIIIIDKPQGLTSHDVVIKLRRKLSQHKIGHAGTLDPMATGVLVIALGRGTKLVGRLSNQDKRYDVTMRLGIKTDTGDITGKILEEQKPGNIDISKIENAFSGFKGTIEQIPPMVSAKKYKGRPLYKYARQGKTVERAPKQIHIYSIEIKNIAMPDISFSVHCSKGTYIRTLCEDIGAVMGIPACASYIRRIKSGDFTIDMASELSKVLSYNTEEIKERIISPMYR